MKNYLTDLVFQNQNKHNTGHDDSSNRQRKSSDTNGGGVSEDATIFFFCPPGHVKNDVCLDGV